MMRRFMLTTAVLLAVATAGGHAAPPAKRSAVSEPADVTQAYEDAMAAQPKLLRITCRLDGSGRITFTPKNVRYQHKHWRPPNHVLFDGEPWIKLDQTPVPWRDLSGRLDLSKARIVQRKGRDVIALEHTPDGFDLYLCDSPNGGDEYAVTIAIPRRN